MQGLGNVDEKEMFRTFNMGIGMVVVCAAADAKRIIALIGDVLPIGLVTAGSKTVDIVS